MSGVRDRPRFIGERGPDDQEPVAGPMTLLIRFMRELEELPPGDAARVAHTLATWFDRGEEEEEDEDD